MSSRQQVSRKKIQYPFIVQPFADGWEVLFTATDWPYREAFFETKDTALDFAENNNECWRKSSETMYALIARLKASADVACPFKRRPPKSAIKRLFCSL